MADSDSDPFQSADEGENESKKVSKGKQSKDSKDLSINEKSEKPEDEESSKNEAQEAISSQDDIEDDGNQKNDDAKDESAEERTDEEQNMQEDNDTKVAESQPSIEASSPQTVEALEGESSPSAMNDRTSDENMKEDSNEEPAEKTDIDTKTDKKEPKAPEEQTIAGSLDRLADAVVGESSSEKTGEKQEGKTEEKQEGKAGGWSAWGGWGSSLLTTATSKVSEMGHGLSHVIENVESSLGVPRPEDLPAEAMKVTSDELKEGEMAQVEKEENSQEQQDREKEDSQETNEAGDKLAQSPGYLGGWFSYGASALTNVVEKTVSGGLDALELIGKKTMDVLQEGDPGFRKKRDYISDKSGQSINLSQMLREAKEEGEMAAEMEEQQKEMEKVHFGILFDNYQGLAHLEALEMLSEQSEMKIHSSLATMSGEQLSTIQTELDEIKDAFQIEDLESDEIDESIDEQDFVNIITEHLFGVCVAATPDKLQKVQKGAHEWLAECQKAQEEGDKKDPKDLHIKAIETVAELSARSIEQFHKSSELMLLHQDKDQHKSHIQRATSLSKLTSTLCAELGSLAGKFCERLNVIANDETTEDASETVNPIITNIYLEASNSSSYIQDAFQLLLPVLQALAIESSMEETQTEQHTESAS